MSIRKNDTVKVLAGKYEGTTGKVVKVIKDKDRVLVEGVAMVKRHTKPNQKLQSGGIIEKEAPIHISNVMFVCPKCSKPSRTGVQKLDDGKRARVCKSCGEII